MVFNDQTPIEESQSPCLRRSARTDDPQLGGLETHCKGKAETGVRNSVARLGQIPLGNMVQSGNAGSEPTPRATAANQQLGLFGLFGVGGVADVLFISAVLLC